MNFYIYLLLMAGTTYLIRMLPLVLVKKKLENRFLLSFLHYVPYSVLAVMTLPDIFYSTGDFISALLGFLVALILAYNEKGLLLTSIGAALMAFISKLIF